MNNISSYKIKIKYSVFTLLTAGKSVNIILGTTSVFTPVSAENKT